MQYKVLMFVDMKRKYINLLCLDGGNGGGRTFAM